MLMKLISNCNFVLPCCEAGLVLLGPLFGGPSLLYDFLKEKASDTIQAQSLGMGDARESPCPLDKMNNISDPSCLANASSSLEYITTLSSQSTSSSSSTFFSASMGNEKKVVGGEGNSVEDDIEQSKAHWSQLVEHLDSSDDKVVEVNNIEFFKSLQKHPTWGGFFCTFGDGGIYDVGELEVGEKFAEGGQGELYHAHVTWKNAFQNFLSQKVGLRFALKVFKKGTSLQDMQKQWPQGMFRDFEESLEHQKSGNMVPWNFLCDMICGTLLQDGRFAFLMTREREDLRTLIDRKMKERTSLDSGPFPIEMAFKMMYAIARGMDRLHNLNIVHRDLKASNVLCSDLTDNNGNAFFDFLVADYECSIGVVGTGFFRAPEILQAIKDKVVNKKPNVFTKAGDVYAYGMVCYEILVGKLPFEGHPLRNYGVVLQGQQLEVPHYVDGWVRDLLHRCWQFDALARPTFQEIVEVLEANSKDCIEVRKFAEEIDALPSEELANFKYHF